MKRSQSPLLLATIFVAFLGSYLVYTQIVARSLQADAEILSRIFAEVQQGLTDPDPARAEEALWSLQREVLSTGIPLIQTGPADTVLAVANLPFEVDISTRAGQRRVRDYLATIDGRNPPVGDPTTSHVHFGDLPETRRLRWIPWLQAGGLLLTVMVGVAVISTQRRAESERAWTAMARELAHQLGTPISSLQGWLEVLRLEPGERPGDLGDPEIADAVGEDLERLERISHRFELIGRDPDLRPLDVGEVVGDLERYLQARLPRFGTGVELTVDLPRGVPPIRGNSVLLAWAFENVVKNALDALAGRGGEIDVRVFEDDRDQVAIQIRDTGPGVAAEIRDRLFEPGVTTKSGGWGVGLALSRRIIEGVHSGRIELLDERPWGATFDIRLPIART
jgi:signal transduction histidine kinase